MFRRILCFFGIHRYEEKIAIIIDCNHNIYERVCVFCNYSPTWNR